MFLVLFQWAPEILEKLRQSAAGGVDFFFFPHEKEIIQL